MKFTSWSDLLNFLGKPSTTDEQKKDAVRDNLGGFQVQPWINYRPAGNLIIEFNSPSSFTTKIDTSLGMDDSDLKRLKRIFFQLNRKTGIFALRTNQENNPMGLSLLGGLRSRETSLMDTTFKEAARGNALEKLALGSGDNCGSIHSSTVTARPSSRAKRGISLI